MNSLVIVVCRNSLQLTRECLKTLLALDGEPDILAVDNASSDGTAAWLRGQQPRCDRLWIRSHGTVESLSTVWNDALRWAWDRGCNEALVVNNDTEFLPCTYERLLSGLKDRVGMCTAVGVSTREQFVDGEWSVRNHPDFSCFMIAKWAWLEVGGFDEGYVGGYFEDANFHVRMHRLGIGAISCGLPFLHHSSGTIKNGDFVEKRRISENYANNKQRFIEQFGCVPGSKAYERLFADA